jgi:hypothetical protein
MFLEDVRRTPLGRGLDLSSVQDLNDLTTSVQRHVELCESRSKREVHQLVRSFEEKLQRAA